MQLAQYVRLGRKWTGLPRKAVMGTSAAQWVQVCANHAQVNIPLQNW